MVALSTAVRLPLLGHPAIARTMIIVTMAVKKILDPTIMLMHGPAEPYRGPGTMARERGVPANFCLLCGNLVGSLPNPT